MKNSKSENEEITKVIDSNRITIPQKFLDILGLKIGDFIMIELYPVEPLLVVTGVKISKKEHGAVAVTGEMLLGNEPFNIKKYSVDNKKT